MHPIPAAKTALQDLLGGRPAWDGVDIRDGQPTEREDVRRDAFWFEPTEIPEDAWDQLGAQKRRVTFLLGFTIAVLRDGDQERATEDVVWTYLEDLMLAIKSDYSLGGAVQQVMDVTGRQVNGAASPRQWASAFTGQITCQSKAY